MMELRAAVPRPMLTWLGASLLVSATAVLLTGMLGTPLWVVGAAAIAPWLPLVARSVLATWRMAGAWMALYLVLAVTQTGHVMEHVVQVAQLRILGLGGEHAHGIFGAFDVEWVHFSWNAWVLAAVVVLLIGRPGNPWLWGAAPLAGWHLVEHTFLILAYLSTGVEGGPGLLAMGGLLGNGLPVARPELHLFYNVLETVPLLLGLAWAWRHTSTVQRS